MSAAALISTVTFRALRKLLFLVLASTVLAGCSSIAPLMESALKAPEVVSDKIKVSNIDFNYIYFDADIELYNPNLIDIKLADFNYDINVEGEKLIQGDSSGLNIKPAGKANVHLPFKVSISNLINLLPDMLSKDELEYQFSTELTLNGPLGMTWSKPITLTQTVPTPKLPEIKMPSISLDSIDLKGFRLNVELPVNNPNIFGVNLNKLQGALVINGLKPFDIKMDQTTPLPSNSETRIAIPVTFSWDNASRSLLSIIEQGSLPDFQLEGSWELNPDLPGFDVQKTDFVFKDGKMI
ncbi:LEA type 2 family protein [Oceanospirillum maris]|jgi:LEA14-like dessication related protein|uniref:NDR1/HIN1-like protein n=1 Tax=Oceanospirillum maris TaxID=64977 RepID=UPI000413A63F|nr:LEA type 2 family protein [Oceanospirillum maris]